MTDYFTKKDAEEFKKEISEEFRRYMGIMKEDFQKSLGFVIDGQKDLERKLTNKIESTASELRKELTGKIESTANGLRKELTNKIESTASELRKELTGKIDSVMTELIAHRDNTEMHVQKAKTRKRA